MGWVIAFCILLLFAMLMAVRLVFRTRITILANRLDAKLSVSWLDGLIYIPMYVSIYADGAQWGMDVRVKKWHKRFPLVLASKKAKHQAEQIKSKRKIKDKVLWKMARKFVGEIRRHIYVKLLSVRGQIGLEDAAYTALLCGGIQSLILSICSTMGLIDVLSLRILPHYSGPYLEATAGCIVYLRPWHIILAMFKAGLHAAVHHQPIRKAGKAGYHGAPN